MTRTAPVAVHLIPVGITNAYALDGSDGLVLIDTGVDTPDNWDALTSGLRGAGLRLGDIRLVLLTHGHFDHSGLAGRVRDASGARVLIHTDDVPLLTARGGYGRQPGLRRLLLAQHGVPDVALRWLDANRRRAGEWRGDIRRQPPIFDRGGVFQPHAFATGPDEDETAPVEAAPWDREPPAPDGTFAHDQVFELGTLRVRAIHTPGHTPGHSCFALDREALLFTGDHVLKRTIPSAGIFFPDGSVERRSRGLPDFLRSLRALAAFPAQRVFPAHEDEVDDLPKTVERITRNYGRRTAQVLEAVQSGAHTAFAVLGRVFPTVRPAVLWPTMLEVLGHLDVLEADGRVIAERAGDGIIYRVPAPALA